MNQTVWYRLYLVCIKWKLPLKYASLASLNEWRWMFWRDKCRRFLVRRDKQLSMNSNDIHIFEISKWTRFSSLFQFIEPTVVEHPDNVKFVINFKFLLLFYNFMIMHRLNPEKLIFFPDQIFWYSNTYPGKSFQKSSEFSLIMKIRKYHFHYFLDFVEVFPYGQYACVQKSSTNMQFF